MAPRATTSKAARKRQMKQAEAAALRVTAYLLALQAAAAYKREEEPLSVPGDLNHKVKRAVYGALYAFLEYVASHSSGGASANPLRMSTAEWEGAYVAINHRDELGYVCEPFLFGAALSHLFGVRPPPVDEYCRHKGSVSTPLRDAYEAYWLLDETSGTYCEVHALSAALMHYFDFTLTRAEQRKIFVYRTQEPAALVGIDLGALLRVLKAQNTVPQDFTEVDMCDMLLEPFQHVFVDGREELLDGLCKIKHITKINWKARLARVQINRKARKARKALIKRQEEAAKVARMAALSAAVAAKPRASGAHKKRKASKPKAGAAKKQKTTRDTTTPCVPLAETDVPEESGDMLNGTEALAGAQDAALFAEFQAAQATARVAALARDVMCETDDDNDEEDVRCDAHGDAMAVQHTSEGLQAAADFDPDTLFA